MGRIKLKGVEALLTRKVPLVNREQLACYTPEGVQLRIVRDIDPAQVAEALRHSKGRRAIGFDIGGKKIAASLVEVVEDGRLKVVGHEDSFRSENGAGYLGFIERIVKTHDGGKGLAVGFSFAGPSDNTKPRVYPNVGNLRPELEEKFRGDLANTVPNASSVDGGGDAETGIVAGVMEAYRKNPKIKKVIYIINGGGIGGAVWKEIESSDDSMGNIIAVEPGHTSVVRALNPYNQTTTCGMPRAPNLPCVERVGSSGQGVEQIYFQQTGEKLDGEKIAQRYEEGDELAVNLYDNAALITAIAILGLDQASEARPLKRPLDPKTIVVAAHGGIFNVKGFTRRMVQILEVYLQELGLNYKPRIIYTKDFTKQTSGNACLDGAEILALIAPPKNVNP